MAPVYAALECKPDDVVLDIGCGTGVALNHLGAFSNYLGIDTDPVAIAAARRHHGGRANARFECKLCTPEDIQALKPSLVVLAGLLHHLSDEDSIELLALLRKSPSIRRAVALDIIYLDGVEHLVSNAFAALDRGRFCRRREGYIQLLEKARVRLVKDELLWASPNSRRARYILMTLIG
jgi:SAM-dependent methyltransferase